MNRRLRKGLIWTGSIAAAVAILVLVLPFLIPVDAYRGRIEAAAGSATGRMFKIDGPLRLTFFPRFGLKAKEVTLANVPGGRAAVMVSVGDIDLSVKLLPLLSGRIALDKIALDQPTIALEVDAQGNPNWKFGKKTATTTGETKKGTLTLPAGTAFSGIAITDGRITYDNAKTGTHRALEHVNIDVAITTADQPISASGDMTMADKKLTFTAWLATLETFLGSGTTQFELKADAELVHAALKGSLTPDGATHGDITLTSPSFRGLAGWFGTKLPAGGLNGLSLSSRIENKDKITRLEDLKVTLDGQNIRGHLDVDARTKIPVLDGVLTIDRLDLNPYLSGGKGGPAEPKQAGWSRKPLSVALVKEFNGRLALTTGSLRVQGLRLGRTVLRIETADGLLHASLDQVALYGGGGKAVLTVDARGSVPQFANTLQFSGLQLQPLLKDALGLDQIEGVGALNLDIRMAGTSANAILHSVSGKGTLTGANGRFKGVDLGMVARTVQTALGGNATGTVASTSFHDIGASFAISGGVMATQDFHLTGPVVQMSGKGTIDLGNRGIDFRVRPQAGYGSLGLGVPFHISGTWDKLHYAPDLGGLMGGVMEGLLGGSKSGQNGKKKSAGDQLKQLFGIH
jgi:AsmA protein